ncbi:MAG: tetratricopeptide repeat protein [Deltaproteobacteria bacterium]|nr:tetratricopeptide repeat protein [Deltaproteobacteria bacterium]
MALHDRGTRRYRIGALVLAHVLALPPPMAHAQDSPSGSAPAAEGPSQAATSSLPPPAQPLTPEELRELEDLEEIVGRYTGSSQEHQKRMKTLLKHEQDKRLADLEHRYQKGLQGAQSSLESRHLNALEELERFLSKYPNDPRWTPDAMFRLAELYLDQAGLEFEKKQAAALSAGTPPEPPPEEAIDPNAPPPYEGPDYTRALNTWRDMVKRFPTYRQIDGALYLLGYYLGEMGQVDAAKQAYMGLVCANKFDPLAPPPPPPDPDDLRARIGGQRPVFVDPYSDCTPRKPNSNLIDESWVRVGEAHFDTRGELDLSIAAYKKVVTKTESDFFDEALYKLAWAYYRNDQFIEGINTFDQLVVFSDKQEEAGGGSVELRQESVDYIAISFADPWEKDAQPDPAKSMERALAYYKGRTAEKHVRDVFEKLGDTLRAGEAYEQSIESWRFALENWPLHPRNPIVHQKVVDALADKGDAQGAMTERGKLAVAYKKGSTWYTANETNREAMDTASRLSEQSLIASAKSTHRNAQLAKQEWEKTQAPELKTAYLDLYRQAATLYQQYLSEFPTSNEVYELTFRLADCYFFSEQYVESVPHYRWVRDHRELGTKYFEPAALSIVQALQTAVDRGKAEGKLVEPPIPTSEALAQSSQPIDFPILYNDLQAAYDEYMTIINDQKTAPRMALASAMISYRHVALDDALKRFTVVMDKYCKTSEAVQAKDGILVIYQAKSDDANFKSTIDKFVGSKCGEDKDVALARAQKLSKEYEIASKLFKDNKFEEAGAAFYELYKAAPDTDENQDDALFSSAVAFEKAGKPKTAIAMYQEFSKNPRFRSSEYFVESLYRTAVSYQNAFDYDSAVDGYLRVADAAVEPGRKAREGFDLAQARLDAMWNAAVLREQDRVYYDRGRNDPGAAALYKRYSAAETKDRKRAGEAFFRAALVYEKAGDLKNMVKSFQEWRKGFGGDEGSGPYVVLSQYKTAKALEKARDQKGAEDYFRATIKSFDEVGERPGSPSSELAAEAQFWLAEKVYRAGFEPYKVKWLGNVAAKDEKKAEKAVSDTLDALAKISTSTAEGYKSVARFESSWSLASIVRLGDISFFAGQKLIEAPVPKEIQKLDEQYPDLGVLAQYQGMIEQQVQPQTDGAKVQWEKAVNVAKERGVANRWSKLAQQRLNAYVASDLYPVQRDEIIEKELLP